MNPKTTLAIGTALLGAILVANAAPTTNRLKRTDSFLGIHFDFHAGPDCTEIGKNTTPEMVQNIIELVHPDYLQIDCKGHRGLSSYPTKVGNPAPGFVGDPLRIWRDVTARNGVALYMHYSGVWDSEAIIRHPNWGAIKADGKTNGNATSFFSPYADRLLIPQLRELATVYGVDGAWVDGECWASVPDYGEASVQSFAQVSGITRPPRKPGEPYWFEWLEFNRQQFRNYLRYYTAELKKTNPEFQLCSNWAFTDHMPERVCAPVDFLSGDYSPEDSVNSARLSARYLARQGKPWDLMAWSFTRKQGANGTSQKTAPQLEREAAVVLALGGGFQAYYKQKRDGSIFPEQMPVMAEVAKFCRARQAICHHAMQVPQIAMLYSTAAHYRKINGLFNRDLAPMSGTLQALLQSQESVELLGEHHLTGRFSEYPLVVIPEWEYLEPDFKQELLSYVENGGSLLLIGPQSTALFQAESGVTLEGQVAQTTRFLFSERKPNPKLESITAQIQKTRLGRAKPYGRLYATNDLRSVFQPAATIASYGKGKIASTCFTFGQTYLQSESESLRLFLNGLVRELFPNPIVTVTGSRDVDVVVNRSHGKLAVNLVNCAGPHRTEPILESIPPVGPLTVQIRSPKPSKVTLEPGKQALPFSYHSGKIQASLEKLEIHEIIVVE